MKQGVRKRKKISDTDIGALLPRMRSDRKYSTPSFTAMPKKPSFENPQPFFARIDATRYLFPPSSSISRTLSSAAPTGCHAASGSALFQRCMTPSSNDPFLTSSAYMPPSIERSISSKNIPHRSCAVSPRTSRTSTDIDDPSAKAVSIVSETAPKETSNGIFMTLFL